MESSSEDDNSINCSFHSELFVDDTLEQNDAEVEISDLGGDGDINKALSEFQDVSPEAAVLTSPPSYNRDSQSALSSRPRWTQTKPEHYDYKVSKALTCEITTCNTPTVAEAVNATLQEVKIGRLLLKMNL